MGNDRKLLELAAKAAGITWMREHKDGPMIVMAPFTREWNPLTDDGDALRLFNKLAFRELYVSEIGATVRWQREGSPHGLKCDEYASEHGNDINAAVRRAIVRAAAEIGRSMP